MSIKYKELEERCIEKPIDFENNWKKTGYARAQKKLKILYGFAHESHKMLPLRGCKVATFFAQCMDS
jgi:hypothetical protein